MQIADFGSGSGEIAVMFAKLVGETGRVTAIDVLPSAVEAVTARAKHEGLANVSAVRADLEVLGGSQLPDSSQDLVYCANVLWQSPKKKEIVAEAARILKPGGAFVAVEWNQEQGLGPPQESRIGEEDLKTLVQGASLRVERAFAAGAYHYGIVARK